ncbi:hypothetical protein PR003_g9398 [Phytophthora rubi]|uniref:Uncharacterized protein n=1 Tax=Phytophthora rubi TaxID=129364 RepID=A0A6A3N146_9STRA|nr:hypothetical protein PR002_g9340 [Phytophthora rubi]KAE9039219.1 hypothetical protein PR001_g7597 [Phytophthora rubi]KAE9342592.1 hypothetical protein PR003_g9398 [Phytophthora rubi]
MKMARCFLSRVTRYITVWHLVLLSTRCHPCHLETTNVACHGMAWLGAALKVSSMNGLGGLF